MTTIERKPGTRRGWRKHPPVEPKVQLPGQPSLEKQETLRVTKITFLPTCSICRNYPAWEVAPGVWLCRGQHG